MTDETTDATAAVDDAQENADFSGGFDSKTTETIPAKDRPQTAETPRGEAESQPEYIQITAKDWAEVQAATRRTASYDQQFSRLFGTTGNLQKLVNNFQAQTPAGRRVEIPKDAFAAMERDFPELAQQTRSALEAALSGMHGTGANDADPSKLENMLASYNAKREAEVLEDAYPSWREIVGAVDASSVQPDPNNPFRKWLATKDASYQNRINGSVSAAVIGRAIRTFQNETKGAPKPTGTPRDTARADRIRSAVQPRGDNAGAGPSKTEDDDFLAGFNSR